MKRRVFTAAAAACLIAPVMVLGAGPAVAASKYTATALPVTSRVVSDKAPTSRVAQPDQKLLARTDNAQVSVLVKLDVDSSATYAGGVANLAPTSPSVTGKPLSGAPAEQSYDQYQARKEADFAKALQAAVPGATVGKSLRAVYGGVEVTIPADKAKAVQALPGVVAVQQNELRKQLDDSSNTFIGAPTVYNQLGTTANAGKGLILANLDSGVWPENPMLADKGNLPAPPGPARVCQFGDNPLTPANDPFVCNKKLIGGRAFTQTYDAQQGDDPFAGTARDSEGHGTHTATTSAGDITDNVSILGQALPQTLGIAPGAYVMEYKVCGPAGCYSADSVAAVGQAILDHVDVINFSISGGTDPFTDPVELAFLDAYAANVFVSASAGNDGPTVGTANHLSPWVTSVAASTQTREFANTLSLTATGGATFTAVGSSITKGAGPLPVVLGSAAPYSRALCDAPAPAGLFTGKIVACARGGNARIDKGFNVLQGGAAGMVLYNPTLADTETDNHWLPATHLADGTAFLAFMNSHTGVTGSFTAGAAKAGKGDVMAAFSSRGPGGTTIKPDITAPGVQILAGMTPAPFTTTDGPPGQYFQAIAGTSMSSPHIAGAALLIRAAHPTWTPGQIRSALMTTATTAVVKEDGKTPADPFDLGSGRVDLSKASSAALTFDETAANMALLGATPLTALNLNIPSVDAQTVPGLVQTTRTAVNVTTKAVTFDARATSPDGGLIVVTPARFTVQPGKSVKLTVSIASLKPDGKQRFGQINLTPVGSGSGPALHLPVAFIPRQGSVTLSQSCNPTSIPVNQQTTCTVAAQNTSNTDTTADLNSYVLPNLKITSATNATLLSNGTVEKKGVTLKGNTPGVPSVAPGVTPAGYLPLDQFGIAPQAIGDEEFLNLNVPAYLYNGVTYTSLAISSNGFIKAGTAVAADQNCCNLPTGPDPAPPNTMVAPFWTDLDGTGAPGVYAGTLTDGVSSWIVIEHRVNVFGTTSQRVFETWIGTNGTQDISMVYDPTNRPAPPAGQDFLVGAENSAGQGAISATAPTQDLVVTSTAPTPGDTVTYTMKVKGLFASQSVVGSTLKSPIVPGTTVVTTPVTITKK